MLLSQVTLKQLTIVKVRIVPNALQKHNPRSLIWHTLTNYTYWITGWVYQ